MVASFVVRTKLVEGAISCRIMGMILIRRRNEVLWGLGWRKNMGFWEKVVVFLETWLRLISA